MWTSRRSWERVIPALVIGMTVLGGPGSAGAVTFPANAGTLGDIPDSPAGGPGCGDYSGAAKNVTFDVSGLTQPIADISPTFTLALGTGGTGGPGAPWVSDLDVTLRAPSDSAVQTIFNRTGAVTATDCGDGSNAEGPYTFSDTAPIAPSWWAAATTATPTASIPAGSYRASTPGGVAAGGANALITPSFAGLSVGQINGTWTLRFHDGGQGDVGNVQAASLSITTVDVTPPAAPTLTATDPVSPADNNTPKIKGSAEAGSTVNLYTNACTGTPAATGTEAELAGAGIPVTVPDNSTTQFRATATDAGSNTSACSAVISYAEVTAQPPGDTTPPETTFDTKAKRRSRNRKPTFDFASNEPGSTFLCRLDSKSFRACTEVKTFKVKPGKHRVQVQAIDPAGNADSTPASASFKVKKPN